MESVVGAAESGSHSADGNLAAMPDRTAAGRPSDCVYPLPGASTAPSLRRHHVVLCVNPDGCQLGLRANANGVDLNRNFPAANWKEGETVYRWNSAAEERDVVLLTGDKPGSEPETQALCQLIHRIQPAWVVSFHDPLACIEDPRHSELGEWLAQAFELPLVTSVGYETPGSFGSWCADLNLHCITAEFPPISSDEASEKYLFAMANLLRWHPKDAIRPS